MKILRTARFAGAVAWMILLGSASSPLLAQLLGPEFQVNSYTPGSQTESAVAAGASGNFVVVWRSSNQDGSSWGIFGQRFAATGLPAGSEFQVNSATTGAQYGSAVAMDGAGNFVVAWGSLYFADVRAQRFDPEGLPVGSEFQVNSHTTDNQWYPAVAADGSGSFVVVWNSYWQDGSFSGVFGQRFASTGLPEGSEFQVNTYTTFFQYRPSVAMRGSGGFVVVWGSSDGQDGSDWGVFGRRFGSTGLPVGGEFQINTYTTGAQFGPLVASDGAGKFAVVWSSDGQDGSGEGLFGQRFSATGLPEGSEFQVNTTNGFQNRPAVAMSASGGFVVVWQDWYVDGSASGMAGQRFGRTGLREGSEFQVNSYTSFQQYSPAVAADGAGQFVVCWSSNLQDGSYNGLFGQRLMAALFSDGFELGDACAWSAAVGGDCP